MSCIEHVAPDSSVAINIQNNTFHVVHLPVMLNCVVKAFISPDAAMADCALLYQLLNQLSTFEPTVSEALSHKMV